MKVALSYLLSLGGLGVLTYVVLSAYTINLSYPAARLRMINTLRTSVNQAEVMCRAAKHTFYEPLGEAIKLALMAGTLDPAAIAATTKPGYDVGCANVNMRWGALFRRGKTGAMLAIGGLALAISQNAMPALHIIVAIAGAAGAIWFLLARAENERSLIRARAELLPELERALAEGRYRR